MALSEMYIDQNDNTGYPPPASFDADACAHAQPVQPINGSRRSAWLRSKPSANRRISNNAKLLLLFVLIGFAVGAMGSTVFLGEPKASVTGESFNDASVGVAAQAIDGPYEIDVSNGSAATLANETAPVRIHKRHYRRVPNGPPRAYRVAVIK